LVDRRGRRLVVTPVAGHDAVAARAELAGGAARDDPPGARLAHADLDVGHHAADRADALLQGVVAGAERRDGRGLGHAVGDGHLPPCSSSRRGPGAPAMMPVRSDEQSKRSQSGSSSTARNIVGTPYSAVQRSAWTASSTARGWNHSPGITMQAPWLVQARFPMT